MKRSFALPEEKSNSSHEKPQQLIPPPKSPPQEISASQLQCGVCGKGFGEGEYLLYCIECKAYLHYRCEYAHLDQKNKIMRVAKAAVIRQNQVVFL